MYSCFLYDCFQTNIHNAQHFTENDLVTAESQLVCLSVLTSVSLVWSQQDPSTAIDFSGGEVGEDGVVCVVREEEREKLEQGQEEQCTQQMVEQCYNTYVTK